MGTGRVVGEPGEPVNLSGPVAVAGAAGEAQGRPHFLPQVPHSIPVWLCLTQSRSLRTSGQMCVSTAPHSLTQAWPAPWEPLSHPSRCTLARWAQSMPSGKQEGQTVSAWQGRASPEGQSRGSFVSFPWGYKRNPQNARRSLQNTVGPLVASGPAQGQGRYWTQGSWWRSPVQVQALEQVPPLGSGEGPPQVLRAPGSRPA